ncbi:MAG: hypothetical protein M1167_05800 [Chloroflexi bacterium]|nr:hypothetical protein [Chloroflexota bacterium]
MIDNMKTRSIGAALAAHFVGQGLTQVQVARKYGVSQSWVGRIYNGEFSERAKSVRKMCEEADIPFLCDKLENLGSERTSYRLLRLLDSVWNGTEEDAIQLTAALIAIKKLSVLTQRKRM